MNTPSSTPPPEPLLRVITPGTTPEDIAAILTVLTTLTTHANPTPPRPRSTWARPHHRTPLPHGPGAWRASSLPH